MLVTGGCGFIGSNLVRQLCMLGARVTVVDNLAPRCGGNLRNLDGTTGTLIAREADIAEAADFPDLMCDASIVFCLAGSTSHADSMRYPDDDLRSNCRGPLALLETLRRVNPRAKIVVASTRQVYGRPETLPVDELHPVRPIDVNGIHLHAAENYYRLFQQVYGLRSVCLRLTNTYGPRMSLTRACHGFVSVFFRQALFGRSIDLFGGGTQRRDFNYVGDVVDALLSASQLKMDEHEIYNLGHHEPHSVRDFAELLCETIGGSVRSVPFPPERKSIDIGDYWGDYEKFRRATGWRPATSLHEGIARTARYYQAHSDQLLGPAAPLQSPPVMTL